MAARSQPVDPHGLFEERCGRRHEHAGDTGREARTIEDGEVIGRRSDKPALKTLASHFGRLSKAESSMIVSMFRRQILLDELYAVKCRFCRDPTQDLARQTLILQGGQFIGR